MFLYVQDHLGEVQGPQTARSRVLTLVCPRERCFGNDVGTKVVWDDENRYLKLFPDVHDHLGEVQPPQTRGQHPTPGSLRHKDVTQMVMDIRNQLHKPIFIIPNNFCSNSMPKNHFLGHTGVDVLLLAVRCTWNWMLPRPGLA